jgi:hypothetical protein
MNKILFSYIQMILIFEGIFVLSGAADEKRVVKYNTKIDLFLDDERPVYSDQYIKDSFSQFKLKNIDEDRISSLALSSNIVAKLNNRPLLKSWFYQRSANIYTSNQQYSEAINELIAATNAIENIYADVTVDRQTVLIKLGNLYLLKGDKENADKAFLEAYSFPYWTFPRINLDVKRRIEVVYRRSIMGMIMARAGNAEKLKEIRIIPAANDLRPKLEEAIKRAEGKLNDEE